MRIGVISDTHGLLRPEALAALAGSEHILHAGDIGGPEILQALRSIAPVTAVRGNNDVGSWAASIPESATLRAGPLSLFILHDVKALDFEPRRAGYSAVVAGHSHRPAIHERDGVLYLNPGSAGPRRFSLPVALAHLTIEGTRAAARIEMLAVGSSAAGPQRRRRTG